MVRSLCILIRKLEEQNGDSNDDEEGGSNIYFVLENNLPAPGPAAPLQTENDPTTMLYAEIEQTNEVPDDLYAVIASQDVLSATMVPGNET